MTKYKYHNGNISIKDGNNVGWINEDLSSSFECLCAVKSVLEKHNHTLVVKSFVAGFGDVGDIPVDPYIRENDYGYFITDTFNDMNYALFSKEMNCAKSCVKAVLDVIL